MKMGEGGAFIAGALVGGAVGAPAGYQAGYNQRDSELQAYISQLQWQIATQKAELDSKDHQIAELRKQLQAKERSIPVISEIRKKLNGS